MGLKVDADIANTVDLFGKSASDLQTGITVGDDAITGTLKYVADYSSAFGSGEDSGNYIALHSAVPGVSGVTITLEVVNGSHGPSTLDDDGICIARIANKSTQTIKVVASKEGCESVTKTFSLTGLTLEAENASDIPTDPGDNQDNPIPDNS